MANISLHYSSTARPRVPLANTVFAIQRILGTWRERSRGRRELATLDARSLRDMGLTSGEIEFEINKPFWRV